MTHDIMPKVIETNRCILRPFKKGDDKAMFLNWCQDPRVTEHLTWFPHRSKEETKAILEMWLQNYQDAPFYHWGIVLKENQALIGSIGLVKYSDAHARGEVGYCIAYDYWHQGITSEALKAIITYLFTDIGFNKLYARHIKENGASGKVMQKCGMKQESIMRQDVRHKDGRFVDMVSYAILKEDFLKTYEVDTFFD